MNHSLDNTVGLDQTRGRIRPFTVLVLTLVGLAVLSTGSRAAEDFLIRDELVPRSDGFVSHVSVYGAQEIPAPRLAFHQGGPVPSRLRLPVLRGPSEPLGGAFEDEPIVPPFLAP